MLINFWARWCTSCLSEMPEIKALQAERGADGFVVLAVNAGETRAQASEFIDFLQAPFTFALDPGLKLSDAYGVRGLPNSIFIDSSGVQGCTRARRPSAPRPTWTRRQAQPPRAAASFSTGATSRATTTERPSHWRFSDRSFSRFLRLRFLLLRDSDHLLARGRARFK